MSEDAFVPHKLVRSPRMHKTTRLDHRLAVQVTNCADYNGVSESLTMCECVKEALCDLNSGFEIKTKWVISGAETVQFRIEQEWIDRLIRLAKRHNISFEKLVNQCVDYVLNEKYKD